MSSEKKKEQLSDELFDYAFALLTATIIELPKMCQEVFDKMGLTEEKWDKFKKNKRYVKFPSTIDDGWRSR